MRRALAAGFSYLFCCQLLTACASAEPTLNLAQLNQELHALTNQTRVEIGLQPLRKLEELETLSQTHSQDMAARDFFDHQNPDDGSPFDRLQRDHGHLLSVSSGENIAMQSLHGLDEKALAAELMTLWRNSPDHYTHLVEPTFWHLGIATALGETQGEQVIYATQSFGFVLVRRLSPLPDSIATGERLTLRFDYLGPFPATELSVLFYAPDPEARIPRPAGGAYIGKAPLALIWEEPGKRFSLSLPANYGPGTYQLRFGRGEQIYDVPLRWEVRD
ncbi:MAG: CAP domain-containing protein [Candidatus Sericytochromatia bacterium]|nr:CAP domain-containing protein [Candidatus Sericytochromatia bacterium]